MRPRRFARHALLAVLLLSLAAPAGAGSVPVSTLPEIEADCRAVPCSDNAGRLAAVKGLFAKMGARPEDIAVEALGDVENVVVRRPGSGEGTVVVGAHYDKVRAGCGAVDNWTGIVALAHLYRSMRGFEPTKTLVFVAFGREEEGLLGAKAMVKSIPKPDRGAYCAMINLDSFGLGATQVAANLSSQPLVRRAREVAAKMQTKFGDGPIEGDADSTPFRHAGIPSVTLHGLSGDYRRTIHSSSDQASAVDPRSVYLGYRLALALLVDVDASPCSSFR